MSTPKGRGGKLSLFKASPFGAPAPQASVSDDDSDEDFFSRSKHSFAILAIEEEERKKRKAEQAKDAEEDPKSASPPSVKKRRTSVTNSGRDALGSQQMSTIEGSREENLALPETDPVPATYMPPQSTALVSEATATKSPEPGPSEGDAQVSAQDVIEVDDGASDSSSIEELGPGQAPVLSQNTTSQAPPGLNESYSSDFRVPREDPKIPAAQEQGPSAPAITTVQSSTLEDLAANAVVSILITSTIPETSALIVKRKLGQRLKEARLRWCHQQEFNDARSAEVVLTWRGKQVYDSTNCQGLGIGVNAAGDIVGAGEMDLIGDTDGRIHMEATTREMLKQLKETKARPAAVVEPAVADERASSPPTEKKVRLILKSKGRKDVKLMVKESHFVSKLVNAFRNEHMLEDSGVSVSIYFDGEELDFDRSIADCEMSDLDTLDVYIK